MKKVCSLLLVVVLLLGTLTCVPFFVSAATEGDFEYEIVGGKATVTKYNGSGGAVVIPSTLGGYPVVEIGEYAFENNDRITSVRISEGVTDIMAFAFARCANLVEVDLPSSLEWIEWGAFWDCSLRSIHIPAKVEEIGSSFGGCSRTLETITVDPGNMIYTAEGNCLIEKDSHVLLLGCVSSVIPNGVTAIGELAFEDCPITSIRLPNSVERIEDFAFRTHSLESINFPEGLKTIGGQAFYDSSLTSIHLPASVMEIFGDAFEWCSKLESITVDAGNAVYMAEGNCLIFKSTGTLVRGCSASVIPSSVKAIGYSAFSGCITLTGVEIPDGVKYIGSNAFVSCESLTNVEIPASVETMGSDVFTWCDSLTDIYCLAPLQPEDWDSNWLGNCKATVHWGETMPRPTLALGDINGNGVVDAADYLLLKRYCLGTFKLSAEQLAVADVNRDGAINALDYMLIKRHVLGTFKIA